MTLSLIIPAHNEETELEGTITALYDALTAANIPNEILVINDNSSDGTENLLNELKARVPTLRYVNNLPPNGFGFAVRKGLECFEGDIVAIVMADASDRPEDVVAFYKVMQERRVDCVFGTRWSEGGSVTDYPRPKLVMNRLANKFIQTLFLTTYNDTTNAFKMYRRDVIEGLKPLLSYHFNLTVELPLKAMVRGYTYCVVPNGWINRKTGVSKLKIKEMGSRYLFIVLYCLIEKWLSRGDYHQSRRPPVTNSLGATSPQVVNLRARSEGPKFAGPT
jgi:dolichol-phosphate mannosyltransferase